MTKLPESVRLEIEEKARAYAINPEDQHDKSWTFLMLSQGFAAGAEPYAIRAIRAEEKAKELAEALEFYAKDRLYSNVGMEAELYDDQGKRAREALKRYREGK